MAYGTRVLWSRSPDGSRWSHAHPGRRSRRSQGEAGQVGELFGNSTKVREMLLMTVEHQRIGGDAVTCPQTSHWLESLVTWSAPCHGLHGLPFKRYEEDA